MPKRIKHAKRRQKRPAAEIGQGVQMLVRHPDPAPPDIVPTVVSQYMASIGRKGGKIGGKRRLSTMTPEERKRSASDAAKARWHKRRKDDK